MMNFNKKNTEYLLQDAVEGVRQGKAGNLSFLKDVSLWRLRHDYDVPNDILITLIEALEPKETQLQIDNQKAIDEINDIIDYVSNVGIVEIYNNFFSKNKFFTDPKNFDDFKFFFNEKYGDFSTDIVNESTFEKTPQNNDIVIGAKTEQNGSININNLAESNIKVTRINEDLSFKSAIKIWYYLIRENLDIYGNKRQGINLRVNKEKIKNNPEDVVNSIEKIALRKK